MQILVSLRLFGTDKSLYINFPFRYCKNFLCAGFLSIGHFPMQVFPTLLHAHQLRCPRARNEASDWKQLMLEASWDGKKGGRTSNLSPSRRLCIATGKPGYKAESTLYLRESVLIKRSLAKVPRVIFLNCLCTKLALF